MSISTTLIATLGLAAIGQGQHLQIKPQMKTLGSTLPALHHLSKKSAKPGDFIIAEAWNFPQKSATVEIKRADGTGTIQNFGLAPTGASYSFETREWSFDVPRTLHEGLFKVCLYNKEQNIRTNELTLAVEQPPLDIVVDFINFKCIHETGDAGDSDESYFFNLVMDGSPYNFKGTGTKVFHDTDAGHTYGSPYVIFRGSPDLLKQSAIVVGMGECDHYDFSGNFIEDYNVYSQLPENEKYWAYNRVFYMAGTAKHEWGTYQTKHHLPNSSPENVTPLMLQVAKDEITKSYDDELIGAIWLKISDEDVAKAIELRGKGSVIKQVKFTGDGSEYLVTFHVNAMVAKS